MPFTIEDKVPCRWCSHGIMRSTQSTPAHVCTDCGGSGVQLVDDRGNRHRIGEVVWKNLTDPSDENYYTDDEITGSGWLPNGDECFEKELT